LDGFEPEPRGTIPLPESLGMMRAYQFAFYTFYQLFEAMSLDSPRWWVWKSTVVISVLEGMGLFAVYVEIGVINNVHWQYNIAPFFWPVGIGIVVLNDYIFEYRDRWKQYAKEFQHYSRRKLLIGRLAVAGITILILGGVVLVLYQDRQIQKTQAHMSTPST